MFRVSGAETLVGLRETHRGWNLRKGETTNDTNHTNKKERLKVTMRRFSHLPRWSELPFALLRLWLILHSCDSWFSCFIPVGGLPGFHFHGSGVYARENPMLKVVI